MFSTTALARMRRLTLLGNLSGGLGTFAYFRFLDVSAHANLAPVGGAEILYFVVAFSIISEASLSFLGAGVDPRTPTWGNMLRDGQQFIQKAWWPAIFPGTALVLLVLALNLLGDALRDALDPRARNR